MLIFHLYTLFLFDSDLFSKVCRDQVCCRSDSKKIPISSSGSAAVTERKLLRTVLFFGPHSICFLGLVLGDIMPIFVRNFIFQQFSIIQLVRFSLCGNPGVFPCFLLSVLSWRVCSLVFFFLVLSSPLCFLVLSIFDTETRLCKARCPHPGKLVYLTYLSYLFVSAFLSYHLCCIGVAASLFSFLLLACRFCSLGFSAFLSCLFCFHFFSSFVSFLCSFICLYFLLSDFLIFSLPAWRCPSALWLIDSLIR